MSFLAWIDFDEAERARARRIMALFAEKETRDELGLGPIRDSIADHLFPGTSVIQTRLRYMLFVPWIMAMVEAREGSPERLAEAARGLEIRLIDALRAGGEEEGVIGREAGAGLRRLPSAIYWAGLASWGIRRFPGTQEAYFAAIPSLRRRRRQAGGAENAAEQEVALMTWHPSLPAPPGDFLERTTFRLTGEEAGFLVDRIISSHPENLLAHLARAPRAVSCDHVWEHPDRATFPGRCRRLVDHAERFSALMLGAALLYNLMLAELRGREDWIERYRRALDGWVALIEARDLHSWSLDDFWLAVDHPDHTVRDATRLFVRRWHALVMNGAHAIPDSRDARALVRDRERRLKGANARFANRSALDRWGGRSGADRLSFRWPEARRHIRDLADAG